MPKCETLLYQGSLVPNRLNNRGFRKVRDEKIFLSDQRGRHRGFQLPRQFGKKHRLQSDWNFSFTGRFFQWVPREGSSSGKRSIPEIGQIPAEDRFGRHSNPGPNRGGHLETVRGKGDQAGGYRIRGLPGVCRGSDPTGKRNLEGGREISASALSVPTGIGNINMENGLCLPFMAMQRKCDWAIFPSWPRAAG